MTRGNTTLSDHELSRIIDFLRGTRAPFDQDLQGAKPDPYWNIVLELVDSHLQQKSLDISSLIDLS